MSGSGRDCGSLAGMKFRRRERLKRNDDIRVVFSRGEKVSCSGAKLFFLENGSGSNRVAFTFARGYGNAVQRNRSRRLSREAFRRIKQRLKSGFDLVLLVYPDGDQWDRRTRQLDTLFSRAGLFVE